MPINDTPFNTKIKLECDCSSCDSQYKILYFEDETSGEMRYCPFCGEAADEFSETNPIAEDKNTSTETLYTDDDEALFEADVADDDLVDEDNLKDGEEVGT
jgi:ubiquitin